MTYYTYNQGAFNRRMDVRQDSAAGPLLATFIPPAAPNNIPDNFFVTFPISTDASGSFTFVGIGNDPAGGSVVFNGLTIAIPEPSVPALLGLGSTLLLLRRRRA